MRAGPRSPIEIISRLMPALIQNVWREQSTASRQALLFGRRPRSTSIVSDPAAKSRARPWLGRRPAHAARRSNHRLFLQPCRHCLARGRRFARYEQRPNQRPARFYRREVRRVSTGPSARSRTPVIPCGGAFALSAGDKRSTAEAKNRQLSIARHKHVSIRHDRHDIGVGGRVVPCSGLRGKQQRVPLEGAAAKA